MRQRVRCRRKRRRTWHILDVVILQKFSEQIRESLHRFMSPGCTKIEDHVSNPMGRIFGHGALEHACQELFNSSHQASRSRENRFAPQSIAITSSSVELAISTYWIQCIVRRRFADCEHTTVLKLTFQLQIPQSQGNFPDAIPKSDISDNQSYHCEN